MKAGMGRKRSTLARALRCLYRPLLGTVKVLGASLYLAYQTLRFWDEL